LPPPTTIAAPDPPLPNKPCGLQNIHYTYDPIGRLTRLFNNITATNGAPAWNTMLFMFLAYAQMGHALGLRSHRESFFSLPFFGNPLLLGAVVTTILLQLVAIYTPFFNNIFNTNPLSAGQLALCFIISTVVFWGVELEKLLVRRGVLR